MSNYIPKKGDRFRVVLEGEATTDVRYKDYVWMGSSYIHLTGAQAVSVEKIRPALRVGWHRVTRPHNPQVQSMYWSGSEWFYSEEGSSPSSCYAWESVGYLGTGAKA
jgi:hypothetical protein